MLQIYLKELRELVRDTRALVFMIVLPTVLMPVLMGVFAHLVGSIIEKDQAEVLKYALVGEANNPELARRLRADPKFSRVELPVGKSYRDAIADETIRFALVIPADAPAALAGGRATSVEMHLNDASATNSAYERVGKLVDGMAADLRTERLRARGYRGGELDGVLQPISIRKVSTASSREALGEKLGSLVPYILILVCLSGVMFPAIDLGVGEKERGTLETLLLTPVPRHSIVIAKFLVLFTTGFLAVFLTLASTTAWTLLVLPGMAMDPASMEVLRTLSAISILDVSMILLMLVPVSATFAAVLLSLSIYARGYKEAQSYMSPMMIVSFMPLILAMLPGVKLTWGWAAVPLSNVSLAIKEICKGTIDYTKFVVIFGSSAVLALACIFLCTWWFQRESVLFRS